MLDDVAVVNISLRRGHAGRQIEFCSDPREGPGVDLDSILEAAFRRVGGQHAPGRERRRIDPTGNAVRAAVCRLIGVDVEWRPPNHLEGDQVRVHWVGVSGHVDVDPVLHRPGRRIRILLTCLRESRSIQVQEPVSRLRGDLIEGDEARLQWVAEIGGAPGQAARDGCRARLGDPRSDPDLHHLRQGGCRGGDSVGDRSRRLMVAHWQPLARDRPEVYYHIGPLGRGEHQLRHRHGRVPQAALRADLRHLDARDIEVQDPCVATVQDAEPVQARLDVQERPNLPVDQHHVAEVLADPGHTGDVAGRVKERPVRVELPVLDDQRDLVGPTRNPDRVRLPASVELVAEDVGGGEPGEHVQPRRAQTMVVEPQERRRHLRQLVRVEDGLRLPETKSVWRDRGVAVAVGGNKPTVKMGHHPHLVAERGQAVSTGIHAG